MLLGFLHHVQAWQHCQQAWLWQHRQPVQVSLVDGIQNMHALGNVKEQRAGPLTTVQLGSSAAALALSAAQIQLRKTRKLLGVATRTQYLERLVILGVAKWGRQWVALVARIFLALL